MNLREEKTFLLSFCKGIKKIYSDDAQRQGQEFLI